MYLVHVGINAESKAEAQAIAALFQSVLELEKYENDEQIFMDSCIEIMKTPGLGKKGHLAFKTENLEAAVSKHRRKEELNLQKKILNMMVTVNCAPHIGKMRLPVLLYI